MMEICDDDMERNTVVCKDVWSCISYNHQNSRASQHRNPQPCVPEHPACQHPKKRLPVPAYQQIPQKTKRPNI